ncbi:Reticulon-like protein B11, partial [Linum perenne]
AVADVLLWRRWGRSVKLLVFSTTSWYLFERAGYNLMTFVANVLFSLVVILFLWAKSAALLNRPLPPIPDMEITEENVDKIVLLTQGYVNKVLAIGCDIAVERKLKVFLKVFTRLKLNDDRMFFRLLLMLELIRVLLSLSIPVLYDRFQHQIDEKLLEARRIRDAQLRNLLKKIPVPSKKDKKVQ